MKPISQKLSKEILEVLIKVDKQQKGGCKILPHSYRHELRSLIEKIKEEERLAE